ncbi:hypothetical protein [Endozoicomonas sp. SCSIO W0465]|nr:hypothetical protein [Endozoicomonas sp. SCSIO W0465]
MVIRSDFGVLLLRESGLSGKLITAILRPGKTQPVKKMQLF